ncbi:hypothetical protein LSH36_440g01061 [Paralvinella palmiformis]|uniref:Uncharacterized protein n=1 Tax=Paralvinella palmiformis TaxID=53620 RepID=A0AAD9JBM2_9ANNE|nr:hypothetical protein LSH36_440g01061 [Paralvinella palmiformis]
MLEDLRLTSNGSDDSVGLVKRTPKKQPLFDPKTIIKTANATPLDETLDNTIDTETKLIVMFYPSRKYCGTSYAEKPGVFNGCEWSDCELTEDQGLIEKDNPQKRKSICNKSDERFDVVKDRVLDALVITETWLTSNVSEQKIVGDVTPAGHSFNHAALIHQKD